MFCCHLCLHTFTEAATQDTNDVFLVVNTGQAAAAAAAHVQNILADIIWFNSTSGTFVTRLVNIDTAKTKHEVASFDG